MENKGENRIYGYKDLEVYKKTYWAAIRIAKEIIPRLPDYEKYDLVDQLRRSSKAIPTLTPKLTSHPPSQLLLNCLN